MENFIKSLKKITNFLDVPYLSLFNNATIALLVAQEALNFKNEIITSPFSFIATAHSIKWNGSSPVFVDTDEKIEILILIMRKKL